MYSKTLSISLELLIFAGLAQGEIQMTKFVANNNSGHWLWQSWHWRHSQQSRSRFRQN